MLIKIRLGLLLLLLSHFLGAVSLAAGAEEPSAYRLFVRDVVTFAVHGETDLKTQLRISGNGTINVPLLGDVRVVGLSLAAAERKIQEAYIAAEIFILPQITLQVSEYSKKEVSMLGQFARQGKIELPAESVSLSIIEAVTAAGGFSRIAKADSVRITRRDPDTAEEKVITVNVERMISGRGEDVFYVFPGDIVFVPERLF